jgi:hypothetical protein
LGSTLRVSLPGLTELLRLSDSRWARSRLNSLFRTLAAAAQVLGLHQGWQGASLPSKEKAQVEESRSITGLPS